MSKRLFERGLKWRKNRNEKVKALRKQLQKEDGKGTMRFSWDSSEVGEHIQSYWEYNRLVGESDGGVLLSEKEYSDIKKLALKASKNRIFVV